MIGASVRWACVIAALVFGALGAITTVIGIDASGPPGIALSVGYSPAIQKALTDNAGETSGSDDLTPSRANSVSRNELIGKLIRHDPLSLAAPASRGVDAVAAGDTATADRAFAQAFRRNPRSVPARIWLAQKALAARDYDRAVALIDALLNVDPQQASTYVQVMGQIGVLPGGFEAIERRFGTSGSDVPSWGAAVLSRLNASYFDVDRLARLNALTPSTQQQFLDRLIRSGGFEAGFRGWLNLIDLNQVDQFRWPYNGEFKKLPAPGPFNWSVFTDAVDFDPGGGLSATYFGRGSPLLAEQTMLLAPGNYRLVVTMSGDASATGGGFRWTLACLPANEALGSLAVHDLASKLRDFELVFSVPPTCHAQKIRFMGDPAEFPTRARSTISRVTISPATNLRGAAEEAPAG